MAIDSVQKRRAVLSIPGLMMLPAGDGIPSVEKRRQTSWMYAITGTQIRQFLFWRQDDRSFTGWAQDGRPDSEWRPKTHGTHEWVPRREIRDE